MPIYSHNSRCHVSNLRSESSIKLKWISNIREIFAVEIYLRTSSSWAWFREVRGNFRFIKVRKSKSCICPIKPIETHFKRNRNTDHSIWRWITNKSDRGIKPSSDNLITKAAVRYNSILRLVPEVETRNLNFSSTYSKTLIGVNFCDRALFVMEVLNRRWLVVVKDSAIIAVYWQVSANINIKRTSLRLVGVCRYYRVYFQRCTLVNIVVLIIYHWLINFFNVICIIPIWVQILISRNDV